MQRFFFCFLCLAAVACLGFAPSAALSGSSPASGSAGGRTVTQDVAPGQTYTSPDGVKVENTAGPNGPMISVKTTGQKGSQKSVVDVPSNGSGKVEGLAGGDTVNVKGKNATVSATGTGSTVNVSGSANVVTVNGDGNFVVFSNGVQNNNVTVNGNMNDIDMNGVAPNNTVSTNGSGNTIHN
jgi:hypothetical protein